MKAVSFTPAATRQWLKLSADIRKRIDAKLTIYATNGSGDVKRLKGADGCRLRIGDWRLSSSRTPDRSPSLPSATAKRFTAERKTS
jgi:mRNA interferase RelE/StbE